MHVSVLKIIFMLAFFCSCPSPSSVAFSLLYNPCLSQRHTLLLYLFLVTLGQPTSEISTPDALESPHPACPYHSSSPCPCAYCPLFWHQSESVLQIKWNCPSSSTRHTLLVKHSTQRLYFSSETYGKQASLFPITSCLILFKGYTYSEQWISVA